MSTNSGTAISKYYKEIFKEKRLGLFEKWFSKKEKLLSSCLWCRTRNINEKSLEYHWKSCRKLQITWIIRLAILSKMLQLKASLASDSFNIDYYKTSEAKLNAILEIEASRWHTKIGSSLLSSLKININDFEFIKPLTKGGYGQIFLVKDKLYSNVFIAKILSITEAIQRACISSYINEREILLCCKSKYIISLLYSFRSEFFIFQIMEYVNCGDLSSHLAIAGIFPEATVRAVLVQLFLALKELKSLAIVHGDIKLENILYSSKLGDNHIKLADFGLAFCSKNMTNHIKSTLGTPEYIAPEQILHDHKGFSSDIWAVGICAFEMLTGMPPFYDESPEIILAKIKEHKILHWNELNIRDPIKNFINRLLDSNYQTRITLEEAMEHEYFASIDWAHPPQIQLNNFNDIIEERNKRFGAFQFYSKQIISTEVVSFENEAFNRNTSLQNQVDLLKLFPIKNLNKIQELIYY